MSTITSEKFVLTYYVPITDSKAVTATVHATGAGTWPGNTYGETCFITKGTGQFSKSSCSILPEVLLSDIGPLADANPAIGSVGDLEHVEEHKVEMVIFGSNVVRSAVEALVKSHPYEVVAYSVIRAEDF